MRNIGCAKDAGLELVLGSIEVCVGVFCVLMDFVKRRLSSLVWHIFAELPVDSPILCILGHD